MHKSMFIFLILLGAAMIAQYFFGFDFRGRDPGNLMFLVIGGLVGGYGSYGFIKLNSLRKKLTAKLGLPENASWDEIELVMLERKTKM